MNMPEKFVNITVWWTKSLTTLSKSRDLECLRFIVMNSSEVLPNVQMLSVPNCCLECPEIIRKLTKRKYE